MFKDPSDCGPYDSLPHPCYVPPFMGVRPPTDGCGAARPAARRSHLSLRPAPRAKAWEGAECRESDRAMPRQGPDLGDLPLPQGWDVGKDFDGKVYFIDHHNQKTTWVDPRDR